MYGVVDEASKMNINRVDREMLQRLIEFVVGTEEGSAQNIATGIYDWHTFGDSEIEGFFSDDYYQNLEHPYEEKKADFETLDEILLVKGMNDRVYNRLINYVTIYSNGRVNVNTASAPVLFALGLEEKTVGKILFIRRGPDGMESTADDVIFPDNNIKGLMNQFFILEPEEVEVIDDLLARALIGAGLESPYYGIRSRARFSFSEETKEIRCVFNLNNGKIVYWREI